VVDQLFGQDALFRSMLHGEQEGQEGALVGGKVAHGLSERPVLRLGPARQTRRIGGQEREGPFLVGLVLGEMKADTTDHVPGGVTVLEPLLEGGVSQLAAQGGAQLSSEGLASRCTAPEGEIASASGISSSATGLAYHRPLT